MASPSSGYPAGLGRRSAARSPRRANPTRTIIATTYDLVPSEMAETRIVPAMAVPNDEPRFETLRERPEISPCSSSGKLDCTTFTDGVSIAPTPSPNRNRPSRNATARSRCRRTGSISSRGRRASRGTRRRSASAAGTASRAARAANEEIRMPAVAAVKISPVLIGAVAVHLLQVDGDDERGAHHDQPLEVLRHQREVADPVSEQAGGEQRFPARAFEPADVERRSRAGARRRPRGRPTNSALLTPACRMPNTMKNIPTAGQDGAHQRRRAGTDRRAADRSRLRLSRMIDGHDQRLEDERRPPVDRRW